MIGLKKSACTEVQELCQRAQGDPVASSISTDFVCPSSANHRPVQHKPPNTPSSKQLPPTLGLPSTRSLFHIPVADLAQYRTFAAPRRPEPSAPGTRCSGTEEPSLFISANPAKRGPILNAESRASRETHGNGPIVTSCWPGKHHPGLHSYHGGGKPEHQLPYCKYAINRNGWPIEKWRFRNHESLLCFPLRCG